MRGKVKTISLFVTVVLLQFEWFVLSVFLQNGCFESGVIALTVLFMSCQKVVEILIITILQPVYESQRKSIKRLQRKFQALSFSGYCSLIVSGGFMLHYCRTSFVNYNIATFCLTLTISIVGSIDHVSYILVAQSLKKALKTSILDDEKVETSDKRYNDLIYRLQIFQVASFFLAVTYILLIVILPSILTRFGGSFPYFFVIVFIILVSCLFFINVCYCFLTPGGANSMTKDGSAKLENYVSKS